MPAPRSHQFLLTAGSIAIFFGFGISAFAAGPDRIILKNGREIHGTIVHRGAEGVTVRRSGATETLDPHLIRRIDDTRTTSAYFAASSQPLPPWEALINDLRANEEIRHVRLIASGQEKEGPAGGWVYRDFEINGSIEMRIYGDPANPAGIRIALRKGAATDPRAQHNLRSFLAGFLTERRQIAALYAVTTEGGERTVGKLRFQVAGPFRDKGASVWTLQVWNTAARNGSAVANQPAKDWENGFERDRDGVLRPIARERVATRS